MTEQNISEGSNVLKKGVPACEGDVAEYLDGFTARYPVSEVIGGLDRVSSLKVLGVGEAIIDEYQYCETMGKSGKEPVLAARYLSNERFAGP